jgi:hypothetical protein
VAAIRGSTTRTRASGGDLSLVQVIAEELAVIRRRPVSWMMEEARRVLAEAFEIIERDDSVRCDALGNHTQGANACDAI